MSLTVLGRHVEMSPALHSRVEERMDDIAEKYFGRRVSGNVVFTREGTDFKATVSSHVGSGIDMQAEATAGDAYAAFEAASEKLGKRLRRHKRRLREDHGMTASESIPAAEQFFDLSDNAAVEIDIDDHPLVIAESNSEIPKLTVSHAVMRLDLLQLPALMFINAANDQFNMIYRRADGHVGWVDPRTTH